MNEARLIDGKSLAKSRIEGLRATLDNHPWGASNPPGLAVILVGEDPASEVYVRRKTAACEHIGIRSHKHALPADTTQEKLVSLIQSLNADDTVHGILLQLPLPAHLDERALLELISPDKDVDGFHPYSLGRLAQRRPTLRPCTPMGIIELLEHTGENLTGMEAVVVGASNIVGRPVALELLLKDCTVRICHQSTKHLKKHVSEGDILVVATGKPELIPGDWIKPGAIVIDVGIHRQADGKLVGDVDFDGAKSRASWITPVPGGVGPMTVAMLMANTLTAWERAISAPS